MRKPIFLKSPRLPSLDELRTRAFNLVVDLLAQLPPGFEETPVGHMHCDWLTYVSRIHVSVYKEDGCTREVLLKAKSWMDQVLGRTDVGVELVYAGERFVPREMQFPSLQELDETRVSPIMFECVRFHGYTWVLTQAGKIWVPATIALFSCGVAGDSIEERLTRMQHQNPEHTTSMDLCRSLASLISPAKLKQRFNHKAMDFQSFQSSRALCQQAANIRDELRRDINDVSKEELIWWLCKAADVSEEWSESGMTVETYFESAFDVPGVTREILKSTVNNRIHNLNEKGWSILAKQELRCVSVLPSSVSGRLDDVMISYFHRTSWQFESLTGAAFTALDGDEEVLVIQLKHCNMCKLLENIGFEIMHKKPLIIRWRPAEERTRAQSELFHLANNMCFKPLVSDEELGVFSSSQRLGSDEEIDVDKTVPLASVSQAVKEKCQQHPEPVPCDCNSAGCSRCCPAFGKFLKATGCLPMPSPSVSPIEAMGAIVFLTPLVTRDLPTILKVLRDRRCGVGKGTLLISKHLRRAVMSVVNPCQVDYTVVGYVPAKKVAFERAPRAPVDYPLGLAGLFPSQSRATRKGKGQSRGKPHGISSSSDTCTASERRTVTTGDVPRESMGSRPNACDLRQKPVLRGHFAPESGFRSHRQSPR